MADSAVVITAGTGTNIDTRTEATNGNHRQVVVLGDPSTNAGIAPVDATNGLAVDVKQSTLPSGAATSAKQDTGNTSLSSIDGKDFATETTLAAIKAKTDNIPAQGQALAAASVPVVLPAAQITTLTPPAAITGFATSAKQDTAQTSLDAIKTAVETIDNAIAGSEMQVDVLTIPAVTNAGTFAVQDSEKLADNAGFTDGTTKVLPTGFVFDEVAGTALTENDIAAARVDSKRSQVGVIEDATTRGQRLSVSAAGAAKVDGSAVTQPVSIAAAVPVTDNSGSLTVDAPVATPVFVRLSDGAAAITALPVTDNASSLSVDWNGTQPVTGSGTATGALRVELPTNGTGVVASVTSLTQMNGQAIAMGTGVRSAGTQRVTIATDDVVPASQSGTWTVQPGNTANTTAWLVNDAPVTSGGLSTFHLVGAATDNATNVKASAGQVYSITAFNLNASPRFLKFHNTAGTPTAGSGVVRTVMIPGNTSGAGAVINIDKGLTFSTGIGITIVTGIADSNTTAISASEVVVDIGYK